MGNGSWSRRRHIKVARSSTKVGREVARQVRQIVMQYLLFRCSRVCVMIIHEETDEDAYLMEEKSMVWCTSRGGEKHIWYESFQERNVVAEPEECCA
ncbi:hypothetical protein F2Q69_00043403 [Brassica cretica]|uniref:Uncharacterized protein n=1 Tax=Brassica cretica TaxID=69181 RepID=A0A8S9NQ40_BRACR|nr:hypothetical protein F2Q69_00043403 [Brassica cretica]